MHGDSQASLPKVGLFGKVLLESCQGVSDPPPRASNSLGGRSSVVGVVEGALLQSMPLFQ